MLLNLCKKLFQPRLLISQAKLGHLQFHTIRKIQPKPLCKCLVSQITQKRTFFWIFKRRTKREIRLFDKPPPDYELIYRCTADTYLYVFQYFGFFALVTISILAAHSAHKFHNPPSVRQDLLFVDPENPDRDPKMPKEDETAWFLAAYVAVFSLIHFFIARMPVRIYYYPQRQKYLLYFYGVIPNQLKKLKLKPGELEFSPLRFKSLPLSESIYAFKETQQKIILVDEYFRCSGDLYVLLGMQQDPDVSYHDYEESRKKK